VETSEGDQWEVKESVYIVEQLDRAYRLERDELFDEPAYTESIHTNVDTVQKS
jgi:hypothetical protein